MSDDSITLPWTKPEWLPQFSQWIEATLTQLGRKSNGRFLQSHIRPWSTVVTVPTTEGTLYAKATSPLLHHEPPLTAALAQWQPDGIPHVLAINEAKGWLLITDSGDSLRSLLKQDGDITRWHTVLRQYAALQIRLVSHQKQLLTLGAMDRRLMTLPDQYEQLLADTDALLIDQEDGLTADQYAQLQALAPQFRAMCRQLAEFGLPETIHHDDFHDGNVFVRNGRYTIADWGETCVSHPFFSLVIPPRSAGYTLDLPDDDPQLAQFRDIYLAEWVDFAPLDTLRQAFALAQPIGMVNRALTWYRVVNNIPEPYKSQEADSVPGGLQEFLAHVGQSA